MFKTKFRSALLLFSLTLSPPALQQSALAQNLPGTAIDESTVAAEIQAIFSLAQQAFPSTLPSASASGWRIYQGFTFKYFATTGIYVGIKDGQVHLLGGPYATVTPYGSVAAVTTALQARIDSVNNPNPGGNTTVADFDSFIAATTLADLVSRFRQITLEYTSSGATAQISLEVVGQESIEGINTDYLKVGISNASTPAPLVYDMWVDSTGKTLKVVAGTFTYSRAQSEYLGPVFLAGFLAALAASDEPQVVAALNNEMQNPALSTKVTKRIVGDIEVDTLQLSVSANGANMTAYFSDFGDFTMMTEFTSQVSIFTTSFEIIDMELR